MSGQLVSENVEWARRLGAKFVRHGRETEDAQSEAVLGLLDAARRYEPERGVPFRAYAARRVWGWLQDWARRDGPLSRQQYRRVANGEERPVRIGHLPEFGPSAEFDGFHDVEARDMFEAACLALTPKQRRAARLVILEGIPQKDAARVLGVSPAAVSLLVTAATKVLRRRMQRRSEGL